MTKKKAAGIVLLGVIILASYLFNQDILIPWLDARNPSPKITASSLYGINETKQENIWVCPMHSEIMQNRPGTCPICGMDLVESGKHAAHDHGIQVDNASIQKLGVRLASVRKIHLDEEVRTYGNVTVDESTLYNVHTHFEGWIKKSYIHSVGQKIRKGQAIYEIYSPDLITQQKDYLRFVARRNQILQTLGDISLQENEYAMDLLQELSRERTKFLHADIGIETVRKLEDDKKAIEVVKILAGQSGVVTQINAREGSFVAPSAALFTLADVSTAWINIILYPDQINQVKTGDEVTITSSDGRTIKARIGFLNPLAENNKVNARVAIENTTPNLRPGSFVDVTIHAHPHEALAIPRSAVIKTGRGDMVILSRGDGHFLPVRIETGTESEDWIEIVDGLQEEAEVAVNGQFLLDSAASMNAAIERMRSGKRNAE
jgi:Cu(I)/Ag(I) efflux system membrane fusion protein